MDSDHGGARNLRLYPLYAGAIAFHAWMPVFFLYLSSRVTLAEVLALEAIYYIAVVLLEVPSGYVSDRYGRRRVLLIAAGALVLAYAVFMVSSTFWALALAQTLLATGLAFNSGSDTSLHLASLSAAGLSEQYGEREARIDALVFGAGAVAALVGGALGAIDLRLSYLASGIAALIAFGSAAQMTSVEEDAKGRGASGSFVGSLSGCVARVGDRHLGLFFAFSVGATVVNHVPYEFYQPYLDQHRFLPWSEDMTPWVAGLHLAVAQLVAIPAARSSTRLARRFGAVPHLLMTILYQVLLIGLMAWLVQPVIALLLVTRSLPRALQGAPLRAVIVPRVPSHLRATYLSIQSLAGRLAFAILLAGLALARPSDLGEALVFSAVVAVALLALLAALAFALAPPGRQGSEPNG